MRSLAHMFTLRYVSTSPNGWCFAYKMGERGKYSHSGLMALAPYWFTRSSMGK